MKTARASFPKIAAGAVLSALICSVPAPAGVSAAASGKESADAYVAVFGDTVIMSGNMHDLAAARAESRARGGAQVLWFRHGGRTYVVRDPAVVAELRQLHAPEQALSREQDALSAEQDELSARQDALSARQDELEHQLDALSDRDEDDGDQAADAAKRALRGQRETLSSDQDALARLEDELGRKEDALSQREDELSRQIERRVQSLLEDVVTRGIAEAVGR